MCRKLWNSQSCCEFTLQWFHTLLLHFKAPVYFCKIVKRVFRPKWNTWCHCGKVLCHKFPTSQTLQGNWIAKFSQIHLESLNHLLQFQVFEGQLPSFQHAITKLPLVKNIYKGSYNLPANINIFFLYNQIPIRPWKSYILCMFCMFCMWSRDGPPTSFQPCLWAPLQTVNSTPFLLNTFHL